MTRTQFNEFLKLVRSQHDTLDKFYKLKMDVLEAFPQFDELEKLFVNTNLSPEGVDWYYWYMYDRPANSEEDQAWEKDGTVIPMRTDDDLWNYLTKNNYVR